MSQGSRKHRLAGLSLGLALLPSLALAQVATSVDVVVPAPVYKTAWAACTPHQVAVHPSRIHVRCTASIAGIEYFALSTADASHAARTLSLLTSAQVSGRRLHLQYAPRDTSGTSIGCLATDCRLILFTVLE